VRGQRHAPAATYPREGPVPTVHEAGWTSGPVWTGAENLALTGIRSPDRTPRRQSLHRLRKLYKKTLNYCVFFLCSPIFSVLYIMLSVLKLILGVIDRVFLGQIDFLFNKVSGILKHIIFGKCR